MVKILPALAYQVTTRERRLGKVLSSPFLRDQRPTYRRASLPLVCVQAGKIANWAGVSCDDVHEYGHPYSSQEMLVFASSLYTRRLDWYGTKQHTASASYDNPATSSSRLDFPLPRLPRLQIVISTTHAFSTYRLNPNSIPENAATAPSKVWTRGHENRPSYICDYDYECEPKAKLTARWGGRVPTRWIEDAG